MYLFTAKLLRGRSKVFGAFILVEPNQNIFVHSQCRSRTFFLVDPKWNVCLAPTPSVGVVHIYVGVRESRSWEHDKSLNKGQQDLTRLNTKQAACVESIKNHESIYGSGRNFITIEKHVTLWFYSFLSTKSPSTLN